MAKRARTISEAGQADLILETREEPSVLDVLDKLLNKGVVVKGDVILGVAGVDLVYVQLSALLSAIDRIMPGTGRRKRRHNRGSRRLRSPR